MSLAASDLPDDVEALKAIIAARDAKIDRLRARLDKQLRDRFGSSSEGLDQLHHLPR